MPYFVSVIIVNSYGLSKTAFIILTLAGIVAIDAIIKDDCNNDNVTTLFMSFTMTKKKLNSKIEENSNNTKYFIDDLDSLIVASTDGYFMLSSPVDINKAFPPLLVFC